VLLKLSILAAEATGAAAEEPKAKNPIIPVGKEILWAFLFFALLYFVMRYVLVPPLQRLMAARDEKVRADLEAADRAKTEAATLRSEYEAALARARSEADEIIGHAKAEADAYRTQLQLQADTEIGSLRAEAQAEIAAERDRALAAVRNDVVELALNTASIVIEGPVDRARALATVERALQTNGRERS
jgi:F-type H+-transporting ATPase subunit b